MVGSLWVSIKGGCFKGFGVERGGGVEGTSGFGVSNLGLEGFGFRDLGLWVPGRLAKAIVGMCCKFLMFLLTVRYSLG